MFQSESPEGTQTLSHPKDCSDTGCTTVHKQETDSFAEYFNKAMLTYEATT